MMYTCIQNQTTPAWPAATRPMLCHGLIVTALTCLLHKQTAAPSKVALPQCKAIDSSTADSGSPYYALPLNGKKL
jgi:hypothetical protein